MDDARSINWFDLTRLLEGTQSQRSAARALLELRLLELLQPYSPVLCGTVPIDCDLPGSDLDILCCAPRLLPFRETLIRYFADLPGFACAEKRLSGILSVNARFKAGHWPIEVIGQSVPVPRQRAFMHMLAEAMLLSGASPQANNEIRSLKRSGLTTEEAFCAFFELPGDPYEALVELYEREMLVDSGEESESDC